MPKEERAVGLVAGLPVDCRSTGSLLAKEPLRLRSTASRPISQKETQFPSIGRPTQSTERYREQTTKISRPIFRVGRPADMHSLVHVWPQQPVDWYLGSVDRSAWKTVFWADFWVRKICKNSFKNLKLSVMLKIVYIHVFKQVLKI